MAHNLTDTDAFQATVQVPDDGDASSAGSLYSAGGVGLQALTNRTRYLYNRGIEAIGGHIQIPTGFPVDYNNAVFRYDTATGPTLCYWVQFNVGGAGEIWWEIPQLLGCGFDEVSVRIFPTVAARAGLCGTPPQVSLYHLDATTGTPAVLVGTQVDTSALVATYETLHDIDLSVATQTFSEDDCYRVLFEGEAGANATIGLDLYRISINVVPL